MPVYRVSLDYTARCVVVVEAEDPYHAVELAEEAADLSWGESWSDAVMEIEPDDPYLINHHAAFVSGETP